MLTRLKVSGFKNLVDVDVRFGSFTCIAGANGAGKSNLFDAIQFLSALAGSSLRDAAGSIRFEGESLNDGRSLFHRVGDKYDDKMSFEVEMIIPKQGRDDLGKDIEADHTLLHYELTLSFHGGDFDQSFSDGFDVSRLKIVHEELVPIQADPGFPISDEWRDTIHISSRTAPLITTRIENGNAVVVMDKQEVSAQRQRKTMLSAASSSDDPVILLAKQEMRSWRVLHLDPSAMRDPDPLAMSFKLGAKGAHIPATLYTLSGRYESLSKWDRETTYSQVAGRLSELIDDVQGISLDVDDKRDLITLYVTDWEGTSHPARALSDGTLRFLALAVIEINPYETGVICLEEPENGISPNRIPALLRLLEDIATDTDFPVGDDNPLRQVIITTHSPAVVQQVPDDSLLIAGLKTALRDGKRFQCVEFRYLSDTWRAKLDKSGIVPKFELLTWLNPVVRQPDDFESENGLSYSRRVIDRDDLRPFVPGFEVSNE